MKLKALCTGDHTQWGPPCTLPMYLFALWTSVVVLRGRCWPSQQGSLFAQLGQLEDDHLHP